MVQELNHEVLKVSPSVADDLWALESCDFSTHVTRVAIPPFVPRVAPDTHIVPPYRKPHHFDRRSVTRHLAGDDATVFTAFAGQRAIGLIAVEKWRDGLCWIADLAIDRSYRRCGAARILMIAAVEWAQSKKLNGIMVSTDTDNLSACEFYASFGFVFCGGNSPHGNETDIALFWRLMFDGC